MTTTTFVTGVTVIEADWLNDVDANTYGTRPVATGGTGATTAADARTNLGLGNVNNTADTAKPVSTAQQTALDLKANLASPTLTGTPVAPTAAVGTNTTQIATTAHVFAERTATATLTNKTLASPVLTGSMTLPAVTLSGAVSGGAQQMDNVVIGANTPLAGGFTTLNTSGVATVGSNIVVPKTSGVGIKVDTASPVFGYRDMLGQLIVRGSGANDPTWAVYGATAQYAYSFSAGTMQQFWTEFHIPHDYVPGTDIYLHVHWSNAAAVPNTGNVIWGFQYTYARGYNQQAFPAESTIKVTQASPAARYQHNIAETTAITIANLEVDGLPLVRVYRDAAAGGDTCTDAVFVHMADVHYQSTNMTTKGRNFPFYT
jgi:hypothetical protein